MNNSKLMLKSIIYIAKIIKYIKVIKHVHNLHVENQKH